jgi:hypothetical protein
MIDIDKEYRTRDGREVRIYATDGSDPHPVHGAFLYGGEWHLTGWKHDGKVFCSGKDASRSIDLIEVKPRITQRVWINVYPDHCLGAYHEKKDADKKAAPHRIGCVQVEIDIAEGEGL